MNSSTSSSENIVTIAKIAYSETIADAVDSASKAFGVNPIHLAANAGHIHAHSPCDHIVDGCAFCSANGNAFCDGTERTNEDEKKIAELLGAIHDAAYERARLFISSN